MPKTPPINDRVRLLEQQLAQLSQQLEQLQRRPPAVTPPQQLFWAETLPASGESYPSSSANKLPVVPLDRDWTKEAGAETATDTPQRTIPVGISYGDTHAPEGSRVLCWRDHASHKLYRIENLGVTLGIVKVGTRGRYHTPPLPDISTTATCTVELIEFTETSTDSGIWQATRTGTVISATHLSTWILLNDTIVVCIPPPHPGAPWIVFPYPTAADFPQLDAIWQPYSTPDALSSSWLEINDIWDCDTSPTTQGGSAAQPVYAHQSSGDKDIVISSPGLYHISLTAEMSHTGITTPPVTCEVGLSLSDSTAIFMSTYCTFESTNDCNKITPRVSETLELDYPSFSFPQRIKAFVRAVGLTGSDAAYCNWVRVHIQPAGYGENQSSQSFPGWATTPPY